VTASVNVNNPNPMSIPVYYKSSLPASGVSVALSLLLHPLPPKEFNQNLDPRSGGRLVSHLVTARLNTLRIYEVREIERDEDEDVKMEQETELEDVKVSCVVVKLD
jgi:hypothetical protein